MPDRRPARDSNSRVQPLAHRCVTPNARGHHRARHQAPSFPALHRRSSTQGRRWRRWAHDVQVVVARRRAHAEPRRAGLAFEPVQYLARALERRVAACTPETIRAHSVGAVISGFFEWLIGPLPWVCLIRANAGILDQPAQRGHVGLHPRRELLSAAAATVSMRHHESSPIGSLVIHPTAIVATRQAIPPVFANTTARGT